MNIGGFTKLTLLDYPDKLAATVFTRGCNLRCPYCHNASLLKEQGDKIPEHEILAFLASRQGVLDGVCITGGEPLLQKDIFYFINKIKQLGFLVKLDTNGMFPDKLKEALQNKLVDYVAMDIKNDFANYEKTVNTTNIIEKIKKSIRLLGLYSIPYEYRITITNELHSCINVKDIASAIYPKKEIYLQRYQADGVVNKDMFSEVTDALLEDIVDDFKQYGIEAKIRN